ncbi:MAG: zinc ribbon domain-containing protein [Actinomycetota bacterium]|nr:zinc ribbon domain-containing protein [Actinomycetota bacterium]
MDYRGVTHQGTHQPLIDPITWQRVQDVLAANLVGERQRDHPHYLKSSVFCGTCGSRLIITNAKNRYGIVYPYFVCLGRHLKTTTCTRKALLIAKIETMVEDHWATIQLDPALRDAVEEGLRTELATRRHDAEREHKQLSSEKAKLTTQRQKLIDAIYSGAVPLDLIASEQQRLTSQLTTIEERLSATTATFDEIETNLATALDLARDCHAAYLAADPQLRRLFNQAFFTHLYIDDDGLHSEYAEPFDTLLNQDILDAGRAIQASREAGQITMAFILGRPAASTNDKTPRALRAAGGLSFQPSTPVRGVEGSNTSSLVPPAGLEPAA